MGVPAPADRRFKRAQLKPGRKRSGWRSWRIRVALAAAIVVVAGYGANRLFTLLYTVDVLNVSRITVRGNHRLSSGEVLAMLDGLRGQNILAADLEAWRTELMRSPWV